MDSQIKAVLAKAGSDALVKGVCETKVADGTTLLTRMHHHQTPVWLMQDRAGAGVTWRSEAILQEQVWLLTGRVDIPDDQNTTGIYAGVVVKGAAHPAEVKLWLDFLVGDEA